MGKIFILIGLLCFHQAFGIFEFSKVQPNIPQKDLNILKRIDEAKIKSNIEIASNSVNQQDRLEANLVKSKITVQNGSLSHAQLLETLPNEEARMDNEIAENILKSSLYILNSECLEMGVSSASCAKYFSNVPIPESDLREECLNITKKPRDGHHAFRRLLPANYKDGFFKMFTTPDLPNPREVSCLGLHRLVNSVQIGNLAEDDSRKNLVLLQWTQFIEHDLSKSVVTSMKDGSQIECCNTEYFKLTPRYVHPACAPLEGTPSNRYEKVSCLNYVRSALAVDPDCKFGAAQQFNQATGYLDLSQLYGFTREFQKKMRTFANGQLKSSKLDDREKPLLPLTENPELFCAVADSSKENCFMAGDSRVNSNPFMIILYTMFLRSHNKVAKKLNLRHPTWNDDQLYNEAKKINTDIYRCIVYNEWLPTVLGEEIAKAINTEPFRKTEDNYEYRVSNEFAVAAIRFYKSMMPNVLFVQPVNGENLIEDTDAGSNSVHPEKLFALKDEFYKSDFLSNPNKLNVALEAMLNQRAMKMDSSYAESMRKHYMRTKSSSSKITGGDVLAWDIQRSRDHGLQGYTKYLEICENTRISNWQDLVKFIKNEDIEKLKLVYQDVQDIDLIIGGISEIPSNGSTVGPTFACILGEQFSNIRKWHYNLENDVRAGDDEFRIGSCSAARLLCETTNLRAVPKNIFFTPSETNPLISCNDL